LANQCCKAAVSYFFITVLYYVIISFSVSIQYTYLQIYKFTVVLLLQTSEHFMLSQMTSRKVDDFESKISNIIAKKMLVLSM